MTSDTLRTKIEQWKALAKVADDGRTWAAETTYTNDEYQAPSHWIVDGPHEPSRQLSRYIGEMDSPELATYIAALSPADLLPFLEQVEEGLRARTARPFSAWHEDLGYGLWWLPPVAEPPYVGTPLDDDWPFDGDEEKSLIWLPCPSPADLESQP